MVQAVANSYESSPSEQNAWAFCHAILPDVSRTFALTIPVLPKGMGDSVCVAYLLCRIADTIEDREDLEFPLRSKLYQGFAKMVDAPETYPSAVSSFLEQWPPVNIESYEALMQGMAAVMTAYASLPPAHMRAINACVQEMIEGMQRMTHGDPEDGVIYVCSDLDELEEYCHYVAGVVGTMLTHLFDAQCKADGDPAFATDEHLDWGHRFGLALQLTNILKDHVEDHERGTSFFPRHYWSGDRLAPKWKVSVARRTLEHLDVAQRYTMALPKQQSGIRLFCLWAAWMAVGTVREVLRAPQTAKISRAEVMEIVQFTQKHDSEMDLLESRYQELRAQTIDAIDALENASA